MRRVVALLAAALAARRRRRLRRGAALNRARREARRSCSISPPTRSTPGIYAAQRAGLLPRRRDRPDDPPAGRIDRRAEAARGRPGRLRDPRHPRPRHRPRARASTWSARCRSSQRPLAAVIARGDGPACAARATSRATPSASPACPPTKPSSTPRSAPTAATRPRSTRVTIGFNAVSSLAAGKVDAATGFWNAEGVALRRQGVPIRIFKVDRYGAPPYPELVLAASRQTIERDPDLVDAMVARDHGAATPSPSRTPAQALDDLLAAVPGLDRAEQAGAAASAPARPPPRALRPPRSCANGPPGTSSTACWNGRWTSTRPSTAAAEPRPQQVRLRG